MGKTFSLSVCVHLSMALSLSSECRTRDLFPPRRPLSTTPCGGPQGSENIPALLHVSSRHLKGRCPSCPFSPPLPALGEKIWNQPVALCSPGWVWQNPGALWGD